MKFNTWLKEEISHIYLFHALSSFANALFSILVPVYLLQLGYTLHEVLWYYVTLFTAVFPLCFLALHLARKLGLKKTILTRLPFLYGYLILLFSLDVFKTPLWIIASLVGIEIALYWMPMQGIFGRATGQKTVGSEISKMTFYSGLATAIAPFVGGVIAFFLNFQVLFVIGMALLALSHIPLFWTKDIHPVSKFKMKDMLSYFKKHKWYLRATFMRSFERISSYIIWPIFTFLMLGSVVSVGAVGSLVALGGAIFIRFVGYLTDKFNKKNILKIGVVLISIGWIVRAFLPTNVIYFYIASVFAGAVFYLMEVPYFAFTYQIGKESDMDEAIVFRELPIWIARMCFFVLAFLFIGNFQILFLILGLFYLLYLFI